jgi:hypothetical protein
MYRRSEIVVCGEECRKWLKIGAQQQRFEKYRKTAAAKAGGSSGGIKLANEK